MTSNRVCIESTLYTKAKNVTKEMEWVMGYEMEDDEPYPWFIIIIDFKVTAVRRTL